MHKTIMVPLDGTTFSERVIPLVKRMVAEGEVKRVLIVRAVPPTPEVAVDYVLDPIQVAGADVAKRVEAERYLNWISQQIPCNGIECEKVVLFGPVTDVLIEYAKTCKAEMIVMATHARKGLSRAICGSTADRMLQSVDIPILMLGGSGAKRPSRAFIHSRQPAVTQRELAPQNGTSA